MDLLSACQMAYRKHHLNDETIGWDELGDCLLDALCNSMGDDGYQKWLTSQPGSAADGERKCGCHDKRVEECGYRNENSGCVFPRR